MKLFNKGPELDKEKELQKDQNGFYGFPVGCPDYYIELHFGDKIAVELSNKSSWWRFENSKKTGTKVHQLREVADKLAKTPIYTWQDWDENGKMLPITKRFGKQQIYIDNEFEKKEFFV